jgi:hypothetical protein
MSGSAGGNRITRSSVAKTVEEYINKVLSKFPGFKGAKPSGSYNTNAKDDFGDIDLIVNLTATDKKNIKVELAKYLSSLPDDVIVPFKSDKYKGKKHLNSGEIITILYPIIGQPNEFVQIDNIVSISDEEAEFKKEFLDYPAEIQGLLLGLAKVICLEEDPKTVFARLGIKNVPELEPNQEYEFNLSSVGLTLRIVTLDNFKETDRTEVWKTANWSSIKKLFEGYKINGSFEDLLNDIVSKIKNTRSKNRIKGIFSSMISVKSGEVGTPKGDNKTKAIEKVTQSLSENISLGKYIANLLLESNPKTIALFPGAFKPPHKGHFEVAQRLSKVADEVIVIISPIAREGITAEQSLSAWKIYETLLPKVKAIISPSASPITYTYETIESNPTINFVVAYGKGEESRYKALLNKEKYPNAKVYDGGSIEDLSATNFRNALKLRHQDDINKFLPQGINIDDFANAIGYNLMREDGSLVPAKIHKTPKGQFLQNSDIKVEPIKEASETSDMTFKEGLTSLTKYFIDKGYKIKPLPKVKIINNDKENSDKLLGKTAYYNPDAKEITLYTLGRSSKDILRSFSHEMIHHIQNLRGDDLNVTTTNTNSSESLDKLEEEAYLKGNMIFRNWEDNIKNK